MLASKHKQWVLDTVDRLRQRKARPDFERISRMVERLHGLTHAEAKESLEKLAEEGTILKVHFKGNISYRRHKNTINYSVLPHNQVYNTSTRIIYALRSIMKETGDGVSFSDLEHWLLSKNPETRLVKHRLENALQKELKASVITKLPGDFYVLTESLPKTKKPKDITRPPVPPSKDVAVVKKEQKVTASSSKKCTETTPKKTTESTLKKSTESPKKFIDQTEKKHAEPAQKKRKLESTIHTLTNDEEKDEPESVKRGRPLSKRKKFKKTHGPDFENPMLLKRIPSKDSMKDETSESKCDFCSLTAEANQNGKKEQLLTCKDCNAKVHPSCMDYSEVLAQRALNSPWQCMECKTCCVCDGAENADLLLFCDACDKGYHMTCHAPPIANKPKGKWVCRMCKKERNKPTTVVGDEVAIKSSIRKGSSKADKTGELSVDEEEEESTGRRGRKKRLKQKLLLTLKRQRSVASTSSHDIASPVTSPVKSQSFNDDTQYSDFTDGTVGASCLPTPSASPRPGDTFHYEMKMSLSGHSFPLSEDTTTYEDATDWHMDDVVNFFKECGFENCADSFKDQEIDGRSLLLMKRNDVLTGLGLKLGPALKIYQKIVKLQFYSQAVTPVT